MIPKASFIPATFLLSGLLWLVHSNSVVVLAAETSTVAQDTKNIPVTNLELIDIDENHENLHDMSSDGSGDSDTEDEEQSSGGHQEEDDIPGSGTVIQPVTSIVVTEVPKNIFTRCQRVREQDKDLIEYHYVPQCTETGEYRKLQCWKHACWCVNSEGTVIKGTKRRELHLKPDCENGTNLSPCLRKLVKHSYGLLGSFRPNCSELGEYEKLQCHGSKCWCTDRSGEEIKGTRVNLPDMPECLETPIVEITPPKTLSKHVTTTPTTTKGAATRRNDFLPPGYEVPKAKIPLVSMLPISTPVNDFTSVPDGFGGYDTKKGLINDNATPVTREPGIMAAIIAGAVVGLFVCILLTMFIVYRMRKKDEGSYPLDEPCKNNYSYTKAPDKEFYA